MPTYTLTEDTYVPQGRGRNRNGRIRSGVQYSRGATSVMRVGVQPQVDKDVDPSDGNGSLTYSASSSVHSQSSTGESTDSSFADILHVLDLDEDAELVNLMAKAEESGKNIKSDSRAQRFHSLNASPADSNCRSSSFNTKPKTKKTRTNNSTGNTKNNTLSGQMSDSLGPDKLELSDTRFHAYSHQTDHIDLSKVDYKAELENFHKKPIKMRGSPAPRHRNARLEMDDPTDHRQLWYSQWWMCGFTDSLNLNEW